MCRYMPDYSFGGFLGFGKGAGCEFVRHKCRASSPRAAGFSRSNLDGLACAANGLSLGRREVNPLAAGCGLVKGFGNYLCQDPENEEKGLPLQVSTLSPHTHTHSLSLSEQCQESREKD